MRSLSAPAAPVGPARATGFTWLWLAAVLIPLGAFGLVALDTSRRAETEAQARIRRMADMLHEHATATFEVSNAALDATIRHVQGMPWPEIGTSPSVHDFLKDVEQRVPSVVTLGLVAPGGQLMASSRNPRPLSSTNLAERDYVRAHVEGDALLAPNGTFVTGVFETRPTRLTVVALSRATLGADGQPDGGVASATLSPDNLAAFYARIAENPRDSVLLLRTDGAVLARHPRPQSAVGDMLPPDHPLLAAVHTRPAEAEVSVPAEAESRIYALRRIGDYPVYAAYGLDEAAIAATVRERLVGPGIVALLSMLVLLASTLHAQRGAARRIAAEHRQTEVEAKLRQLERVGAFGELAAGVAHDFRNAAQMMESCARLLHRAADNPARVREHAELVARSATLIATLTNRMLDIARRRPRENGGDRFDAAEVVAELSGLLSRTLGHGMQVAMRRNGAGPFTLAADRSEFEAALVNLAVNARDALPDGGEVVITVGAPPVELANAPSVQGELVVAVIDRGTGMDAETLARAGEPFFTTKRSGQGTGLGLAGARGFAERAGGRLTIQSRPGEGTVVALWLPALGKEEATASQPGILPGAPQAESPA